MTSETISLTFSDQGENNVGMQLVGKMVPRGQGFHLEELKQYQHQLESQGLVTELHRLNDLYQDCKPNHIIAEAGVLVVRNALGYFIGPEANSDNLWQEMTSFDWDRKYYCTRRNKVLNKHARANVCFGNTAQPPDYPNRKGTIIGYDSVPILNSIRNKIPEIIGDKGKNLVCEGNRYFDLKKCGIGWHGDKERRKVIAFRLGATMKLCYHWHYRFKPVGKILEIDLNYGDMYLMSEKAVGTDWGSSAIYTLRHAAGPEGSKYLKLKEK